MRFSWSLDRNVRTARKSYSTKAKRAGAMPEDKLTKLTDKSKE